MARYSTTGSDYRVPHRSRTMLTRSRVQTQSDWEDNERAQLRSWLEATPAQRLVWLEEAIKLAYQAGAPGSKQQAT